MELKIRQEKSVCAGKAGKGDVGDLMDGASKWH